MEGDNGVAESGEGAANLAVFAFGEDDFKKGSFGGVFGGIFFVFGNDSHVGNKTVIETDAVVGNHLLVKRGQGTVETDKVVFFFVKAGVGHLESKITIIGQKDDAGGILI